MRSGSRRLEDENRPLKKLLAEAVLDNAVLKHLSEKRLTPAARRAAAIRLIEHYHMSRVRACRLVGLNRSSLTYQPKRPDDSLVRERLRALAANDGVSVIGGWAGC